MISSMYQPHYITSPIISALIEIPMEIIEFESISTVYSSR